MQEAALLGDQLSQTKIALEAAGSQSEVLQREARESKQQAAQASAQVAELQSQLSALAHLPSSGVQSPTVEEIEQKLAAALRGKLELLPLRSGNSKSSALRVNHILRLLRL